MVFLTLLNDKNTRSKTAMNIINHAELPLTSAFLGDLLVLVFNINPE